MVKVNSLSYVSLVFSQTAAMDRELLINTWNTANSGDKEYTDIPKGNAESFPEPAKSGTARRLRDCTESTIFCAWFCFETWLTGCDLGDYLGYSHCLKIKVLLLPRPLYNYISAYSRKLMFSSRQ